MADAKREQTMRCGCGCCGAVAAIRSGNDIVALLQIGSANNARNACRPVSPKGQKYRAAIKLAGIFSEQLSALCNHMLVQKQHGESPVIRRAKDFITEHFSEDLSSRQVAKELHLSRFYFCKLFKNGTGLTFTAYLAQVRIARVKELLRNPSLRVSEIAFQTGFQSLTHFNRLFAKITGQSPTEYRRRLRLI